MKNLLHGELWAEQGTTSSKAYSKNQEVYRGDMQGVPPPDDSFSSDTSSLSIVDTPGRVQVSQMKDINKEIRRAATLAIKKFKHTSRDLLSVSRIDGGSGSIHINDMEHKRNNPSEPPDVFKEKFKDEAICFRNNATLEPNDMEMIFSKIQEIQKEINQATHKLLDSEKLICNTEESNEHLENRIKKLEETIHGEFITEGPEKSHSENCLCIVF
ncbi:hypothetical protein SteCoe_24651 [Stentor coeruleus]|uniref:Uncharacterized protein n=1 Tax=Stentor coeruleus TaxID=5963 RepID=A0A1R2BH51_9CILI|nr:hypothetical protein SteCoe_24651 [Stentor coeruleus]